MRTVSYRLADLSHATIRIGRVGENDYTRVIFDSKTVFDDYPRAVPALTVKPPAGAAYPAVATREGDLVIWDVTDSDLVVNGYGEAQLTFTEDGVVCKSCIAKVVIDRSIRASGQAPDPVEDWLTAANTALNAIPQTIDTALEEAKASGEFDGEDGFSPAVSVTEITDGHRVSVTDAEGTETFDVMNGEPGQPGQPGAPGQPGKDGVSPTVSVTPITDGHQVTITDKTGDHSFNVMDGEKGDPGDPTELIDDTTTTATNKVWSAKKSADTVSTLNNQIGEKYTKPQTGIPATDLESGVIPSVPVQDVQVNGTSVLSQGVANVPIASSSAPGVAKVNYMLGVGMSSNNELLVSPAVDSEIKGATNIRKPIVPSHQHESLYYALAKLAGADMASVTGETVGVYPEAQKIAIQKMLGIYEAPWELIREDTVTNATEADIEITVDGNGNAFELTDIRLIFHTPTQETAASVTSPGRVKFYYGSGSSQCDTEYIGAYTQAAGASARTSQFSIEQRDGMIERDYQKNASNNGEIYAISGINITPSGITRWQLEQKTYTKIVIESVTGKAQYKLYGRRKWT